MSSSSASLLYGITVNIHDLIRGARAFAKFTKNAVVLDLLLARKQRPTTGVPVSCTSRHCHLSSADKLSTLPAELLVLIRDHLRHSYIAAEPSYFLQELHWEYFAEQPIGKNEEPIQGDWSAARWKEHEQLWGCDLCFDVEYNGSEEIYHDGSDGSCQGPLLTGVCKCTKRSLKRIRNLLSSYGLALPSTEYFNLDKTSASKLSWAITLPAACENATETACWVSEDRKTSSSHHVIPVDEPDLQTALYFDPSYFQTSEEDDRKLFRRFVRNLELRITKVEGGTARRLTKGEVEERSRAMERKVREKEAEERRRESGERASEVVLGGEVERPVVQPRWMLVQSSVSEW